MKLFLKKIAYSVIILLFLYPIFIFGGVQYFPKWSRKNIYWARGGNGHMFTRLREVEKTKNIDLLILGSSLAYRAFDTRIFEKAGLEAFNLGSSRQTPMQTNYLLNKYLDQLNPKYVIWEVSPFLMIDEGLESTIDLLSNKELDIELLKMSLSFSDFRLLNTATYVAVEALTSHEIKFEEQLRKEFDSYVPGGYVESSKIEFGSNYIGFLNQMVKNEIQLQFFDLSLKKLKERNIKVVLIFSPVTAEAYLDMPFLNEYKLLFNELKSEQRILKFIDFNLEFPEITNNKEFFYDEFHLNKFGVSLFNLKMIKKLQFK